MSAYLMGRLIRDAGLSPRIVTEAFVESERRACSVLETLVVRDIRLAEVIAECFSGDGSAADPAWRLDSGLMRELPPGMPERLLAFPFRERAGALEVVTVTPLDQGLREELEVHLGSSPKLYRGSLQALLAAAGARVDWHTAPGLSRPPPSGGASPLPLVRRQGQRTRERVRTSPGLGSGRGSPSAAPQSEAGRAEAPVPRGIEVVRAASRADLILSASRAIELAQALGPGLPSPAHIGALGPHGLRWLWGGDDATAFGPERYSALDALLRSGSFRGSCLGSHLPLGMGRLYPEDTVVRVELIGETKSGLLVLFPDTDSSIPLRFVALTRARWAEM